MTRPSDAESPPARIGPYRVLGLLGRGGMGVVYRAEHAETGASVALKTVRVAREDILASLRREIHALARIRHPGVVRIVGEGVWEGIPWYAMELLQGTTLREWMRGAEVPTSGADGVAWQATRPLSDSSTPLLEEQQPAPDVHASLTLLRSLCDPLAFLHGEGIVHRDLKPENILIRADGAPVLMDFGLMSRFAGAVGREALELAGPVSGTLAYMAPEQLRGELVDARADLYALGCIMFELLAGAPPFPGSSVAEIVRRHMEEPPPEPSRRRDGLPPAIDALVCRLLAKEPNDRMGHASDVAAALARLGAGEGGPRGPRPRGYLYRPRLAGREDVVRLFDELLAGVSRGSGALALVGGESGVGRTRLLSEIAGRAHRLGLQVLAGACPPSSATGEDAGGDAALRGLRGPLQTLADRCRDRGPAETTRILGRRAPVLALYEPAIGRLDAAKAMTPAPELPAEASRLRLWSYLAETLRALSDPTPVLLVLDDLQGADDLTLGFLEYLLRGWQFQRLRLLVIGTYRQDDVPPALRPLLEAPGARHVRLGRLDAAGVGAMAADMLALAAPPAELLQFLVRHSEGIPRFVAEYLWTAVREEILTRDATGRWCVATNTSGAGSGAMDELPLPRSLRELLARRLSSLDDGSSKVLDAAAVLGRQVEASLLASITGLAEHEVLDAVHELQTNLVLEEEASGKLRFVHGKLRQIVLEGISAARRRRLHRAAAEAIGREADAEGLQALLAYQWEQAGDVERSSRHYLAAARDAVRKFARQEAEAHYRTLLRLVVAPDPRSVDAHNALGSRVLKPQGRTLEALAEHERARAEAAALGDRHAEGQSLLHLGRTLSALARGDDARRHVEQAATLFTELGSQHAYGEALVALFHLDLSQGRWADARTRHAEILSLAQVIGDARLEAEARNGLGVLAHRSGFLDEAQASYEGALTIHRRIGTRLGEGHMLGNLSMLALERGRLDEARELGRLAIAIAREVGDRRFEGSLLGNLAELLRQQGQLSEAEAEITAALSIARECGDRAWEGIVLGNFALIHEQQGRLSEARELHERALDLYRSVGDPLGEGFALSNSGALELQLGRPDQARSKLERALAIFVQLGDARREGAALMGLAAIDRIADGDLPSAEARTARAEAIFGDAGNALDLVWVACERGHARLARGEAAWLELDQARRLAAQSQVEASSETGRRVARLERAVDAFDAGRELIRGEVADDLPPTLRGSAPRTDARGGPAPE